MPDEPASRWMPAKLLKGLASTFWVSLVLTFSVNASVASLWSVFVPSDTRFDHRIVLLAIICAITLVGAFAEIARRALAEADEQARLAAAHRTSTPIIRSGVIYQDRTFLVVTEANALVNDTAVAIYRSVSGLELEIGVGRVNRIERSETVQIEIVDRRDDPGVWERIGANERGLLSTLTVRTALPFDVYQRIVAP